MFVAFAIAGSWMATFFFVLMRSTTLQCRDGFVAQAALVDLAGRNARQLVVAYPHVFRDFESREMTRDVRAQIVGRQLRVRFHHHDRGERFAKTFVRQAEYRAL